MKQHECDLIIVGQGIAGTILAHVLISKGKKILLMDEPSLSSCSRVSGGMFNPVVFKRLTASWMADELIPVLGKFYGNMEQLLGEKLLHFKPIVKIFSEKQERELWEKKRGEAVGKFLSPVMDAELENFGKTKFGWGMVERAGYLDTKKFLALSNEYFRGQDFFLEERFDHSLVRFGSDEARYKDMKAKKIIFCEGYLAQRNPFFSGLPFNPAKGESLLVRLKKFHSEKVINKGVALVPLGGDLYRVGSTFSWKNINDEITQEAREELLDGLKRMVDEEVEIVDQKAGVRPALNDRRPVMGLHREHLQLGIFNGLGSKGVMLAPYFAQHFYDHLEKGTALNAEVNVGRFYK
ncbi:MAG TPA: FAD-dependent oxidoreductase [Bacteroidia bacterium]|jgi:glycine/D-amino acid oxidase-like deaminating enzyme